MLINCPYGASSGHPDLGVLDLLVSVAETGSLGAAARQHGISQPAASMRIRALERRLRLVLLERGPTGSRLTDAGLAVVGYASPVLAAAHEFVTGVAALHSDQAPRLVVAASRTIADHRMPLWLTALRARHADVAVSLEVGNTQQVCELVRAGGASLGFIEGLMRRPVSVEKCWALTNWSSWSDQDTNGLIDASRSRSVSLRSHPCSCASRDLAPATQCGKC